MADKNLLTAGKPCQGGGSAGRITWTGEKSDRERRGQTDCNQGRLLILRRGQTRDR